MANNIKKISIKGLVTTTPSTAQLRIKQVESGIVTDEISIYVGISGGSEELIPSNFISVYSSKTRTPTSKISISPTGIPFEGIINGLSKIYKVGNTVSAKTEEKLYEFCYDTNTYPHIQDIQLHVIIQGKNVNAQQISGSGIIPFSNRPKSFMCDWKTKLTKYSEEEITDILVIPQRTTTSDNTTATNNTTNSTESYSFIIPSIDVTYHIENDEPLYISHPQLNLWFGYNKSEAAINVSNVFSVFYETSNNTGVNYTETKIPVQPKLLTNNLVQLTFVKNNEGQSKYVLAINEEFTNKLPENPTTQNIYDELKKLAYSRYFWKGTLNSSSNIFEIFLTNLKYYDDFKFVITPEEQKNYYSITLTDNIKTEYKFNYFFHIIQPKSWQDEKDEKSGYDFYMYYAQFATCYCDKDNNWFLYFNPGGYLKNAEIYIGMSVMSVTGEHVNIGTTQLIRNSYDTSTIFKETKKHDLYERYGDVNGYLTFYDNFTHSTETTGDDVITNIAENVLDPTKSTLYLDSSKYTGLFVNNTDNMDDKSMLDFKDGDLAYPNSVVFKDGKYSVVIYSKQFSQLFDREITEDDIKEIDIVGPVAYNIKNNFDGDRNFDFVQVNQETNGTTIDENPDENRKTKNDNVYCKVYGKKDAESSEYENIYIYAKGSMEKRFLTDQNVESIQYILQIYSLYDITSSPDGTFSDDKKVLTIIENDKKIDSIQLTLKIQDEVNLTFNLKNVEYYE